MHIARLRLKHFGIFRGEHELILGPTTYAIVAVSAADGDKSNGSGKTTLLEAIGFALWGRHRHRNEDAWISRGEPSGEVELELSDGTRIVRSRPRGKSTRLYFFPAGAPQDAMIRDEAGKRLEEVVGLSEEDYFATRHLEQRQVARFLLARPEERMQAVSAWVGLGPLERCEDSARARLQWATDEALRAEERRKSAEARIAAALGKHPDVEVLVTALGEAHAKLTKLRERVYVCDVAYRANAEALEAREAKAEYDELVAEGTKLRAEVDAFPVERTRTEHAKAKEAEREAATQLGREQTRVRQLAAAAKGTFDGHCPVAEIECPARAKINGMRSENRAAHEEAMAQCDRALDKVKRAGKREVELDASLQAQDRAEHRLRDLRARAVRLQPKAELVNEADPEDQFRLHSRLEQVRAEVEEAIVEHARLERAAADVTRAEADALKASLEANAAAANVEIARAALLVLGRSGAQRRVAEGALGQIEALANDSLAACGEDLRVTVAWAREGQGLATACDSCGASYPASTKVKTCARCGGPRGPKLVHRLDLDLSDRSGGLEDFAGCALALAAGTWLSRARGAAWGTALLDEPLSSLDASRRRSLIRGLPAMLAAGGIEQTVIVAHTPAAMDALPARIQVTRRGAWSDVRIE